MSGGCSLAPIPAETPTPDSVGMVELAIRCHPCVPVDAGELESWLERQLGELRGAAPESIVRFSRLTQALPDSEIAIGWLVEMELQDDYAPLVSERLGEALRDMRLLGLQPKVLTRLANCTSRPMVAASDGAQHQSHEPS